MVFTLKLKLFQKESQMLKNLKLKKRKTGMGLTNY